MANFSHTGTRPFAKDSFIIIMVGAGSSSWHPLSTLSCMPSGPMGPWRLTFFNHLSAFFNICLNLIYYRSFIFYIKNG